jgi:tRNA uridine 5-carboxymethylaminomethyl modification enzyme
MATAIDRAGIQFRTLNASKGPAVRATRAQADRERYKRAIRALLEGQPGLTIVEASVDDLIVEGDRVGGAVTGDGESFLAPSVVLTVGTFLGGRILIGNTERPGGRAGDPPSVRLAHRLREMSFRVARLKTGTPPRLDGRTLNFAVMQEQPGDTPAPVFSFRASLHESPMYSGKIDGVGPRYCPSVEDKIVRFADKSSHQIFVEPEGLNTHIVYPNGISTSLPAETQERFVRTIVGFEDARITQPGYAIEYDYFDPRDLRPTLETRHVPGLWFAGQINGTTGYEEAGAQGILAGINAARAATGREGWFPRRDEAYIGVLVDDLVTRGVSEPYRMFTSRAEYRLTLREDNADERLTPVGRELGVVDERRWALFESKRDAIGCEQRRLDGILVRPADLTAADRETLGRELQRESTAADLLRRPELNYRDVTMLSAVGPMDRNGLESDEQAHQIELAIEVRAKYAGYIDRQHREIAKHAKQEQLRLPDDLDYASVDGLSNEARQRLELARPGTLGQASRLEGMTPSAVSLLLIHLKKRQLAKTA